MKSQNFWDIYELVGDEKKVTFLNQNREKKKCRFCKNTEPEVKFEQKAHLIPELLGKNEFTIDYECDQCNQRFSKYESHLAIFVRPYLTLMNIRGKKKVPIFQSRTENRESNSVTTLAAIEENRRMLTLGNLDDYKIDKTNNKVEFKFRNSSLKPKAVYKSLVRIGLALLPESEIQYHKKTFDWLIENNTDEKIEYIRYIFITTLKRKKFLKPIANLFKARSYSINNEAIPNHILIIGFANQVFQVYLPFSDDYEKVHDKMKPFNLELYPSFSIDELQPSEKIQIKTFDLGIEGKIQYDTNIEFSFEEIEMK